MDKAKAELLQAVNALYHHREAEVKDQADRWLEQWQTQQDAWLVADNVLHDSSASVEAHYFCAQTLRTKVEKDLEELPPQAIDSLRQSLLQLLLVYANGATPVRTQLCLALTAMAAHVPAAQWQPGGGIVPWLAQQLQQQQPAVALPCLLDVLTHLPEEAGESTRAAVRSARRSQALEELRAAAPSALELLSKCLQQQGDRVHEHVLKAFSSWLRVTGGHGLPASLLVEHPLVKVALEGLASMDGFESAVQAVGELIWCTIDSKTGAIVPDMLPLAQTLVPQVMQLRSQFAVSAKALQEEQHGGPDGHRQHSTDGPEEIGDHEEVSKGVGLLIVEMAEAFLPAIASGDAQYQPLLDAVLEVTAHPLPDVSAMTFRFWHLLAFRAVPADPGSMDEEEENEEDKAPGPAAASAAGLTAPKQHFQPIYQQLVTTLQPRTQFPEVAWMLQLGNDQTRESLLFRSFASMNAADQDDFKRYRFAAGDSLLDASRVLGPDLTVDLVLRPLMQVSSAVAAGKPFNRVVAESALFCLKELVHKNYPLPSATHQILASLFTSLPDLPSDSEKLSYSACFAVERYAPWLEQALQQGAVSPQALTRLMEMAVQRLNGGGSVAGSAAHAIQQLCQCCRGYLAGSMSHLMSLVQQVLAASGRGGEALLSDEAVQLVMRGVCAAAHVLPQYQLQEAISGMATPITDALQAEMARPRPADAQLQGGRGGPASSSSDGSKDPGLKRITAHMERISTIMEGLEQEEVASQLLEALLPLLGAAFDRAGGSSRTVEATCRVARYGLKAAGRHGGRLVPHLAELVSSRFKATCHPAFLYLASQLVKTYAKDPAQFGALSAMLGSIVTEASAQLRSLPDFSEKPDLADDLFLLASRCTSYAPALLVLPQLLPLLLQCATAGMLVQQREASMSTLAFLYRVLLLGLPRSADSRTPALAEQQMQLLLASLPPLAPGICRQALAGAVGSLPRSRSPELARLLWAMLRVCPQAAQSAVQQAVAAIPEASLPASDKQHFLAALAGAPPNGSVQGTSLSTDDQQRSVESALSEIGDACRRTTRTRQAAEASLLPPELYQQLQGGAP